MLSQNFKHPPLWLTSEIRWYRPTVKQIQNGHSWALRRTGNIHVVIMPGKKIITSILRKLIYLQKCLS